MTANQRIIVNFLATYGRSLFALACGLFSGRWMLMALGEVDYGLYGVVGGLTAFVSFFNTLMAGAVSRFYAFHVGAASVGGEKGLETCRQWFTTAVVIHTIVPVLLVLVGYPVGTWAVREFLTIPPDRIEACIWVWRFACLSCLVGMVTVPFCAMYTAKQEIAEMTLYSVVQTALNVCVLYYMVSHPGSWLAPYAACACLIATLPQVVMGVRAVLIFPECRFRAAYLRGWSRVRELVIFASLRFFGACTIMIQGQGMAILTNKLIGPARNAAMTVGNSLSVQSETLANALDTALGPAITNACGAGDYAKMRSLCFHACKFGTVLMLVFALPLSMEVEEVMRLWLVTPPDFAASLCVCMLVCLVLEKACAGHWMALFAMGRIGWYQLSVGVAGLLCLPIAWLMMRCGFDLMAVGYGLIVTKLIVTVARLLFGRAFGGLSVRHWLVDICLPLLAVSALTLGAGWLSAACAKPGFLRVVQTTAVMELVFLPLCWRFVLSGSERESVVARIRAKLNRRVS